MAWPVAAIGLSGGEQQRVQLARCLAQLWRDGAPQGWLFLDEPTSALDLYYQQHLLRLLKRLTAGGLHPWCCMTLTSPRCGPTAFCCFTGKSGRPGHAAGGDPAAGYPSLVRADVRLVQHPDNAAPQVYLAP
jgi:iron complex transport system ATP-binding protein